MTVSFKWIGAATCILTIDTIKIGVDPVLCSKDTVQDYFWFKSKRIEAPVYKDSDFDAVNLWLITHNHEDHIDKQGLDRIAKSSQVISNKNSLKKLTNTGLTNSLVLSWGAIKELNIQDYTIRIEAIPAIHGVNPISALFAGKVNGYFLSISKGIEHYTIYFTSDTVYKKRVIKALRGKRVDLLIPNMGAAKQGSWIMTLTLNAKMLKKMIEKIKPKFVIPIHYGTFEHYKEPINNTIALQDKRIEILPVGRTKHYIV